MAFGGFARGGDDHRPVAEINMIPLIDVMLVLLVIFIITAPLLTHAVKIDLPSAASAPNDAPPRHVRLAIGADGTLHWNDAVLPRAALEARLAQAAAERPQPELHLYADRATRYQEIAEVLAASANAGLARIGFVSVPRTEER